MNDLDEVKNEYKTFTEKAENCLKEDSFKEAIEFYQKAISSIKSLISLLTDKCDEPESEEKEDSDNEDAKLRKKLNNCLIQNNPKVKWDDIPGLEKAKQILKDAAILPIQFPQLFVGKLKPIKAILLYGPSGTGKSHLVKALINEANIPSFSASAADIISSYMGESEKLIKNLFDLAGKETHSIIFLDQIDFILAKYDDGINKKIMNELLKQMREVENKNKNILVIGSTNMPWVLDPLALKLFQKKIYIGLPAFEERKLLFKIHLSEIKNNLEDEQFNSLSELTEGYSGSDVYNLIQEALYEPLRKNQSAPGSKKEEGEIVESSGVSYKDLVSSLENMKKSVTEENLKKFNDFTEEFGIQG